MLKKDNPLEAPKKAKPELSFEGFIGDFCDYCWILFPQLSTSFTILGTNTALEKCLS